MARKKRNKNPHGPAAKSNGHDEPIMCKVKVTPDFVRKEGQLHILAAAIRDDKGQIHYQPAPARHNDIIREMREAGYKGPVHGDHQGFLLSNSKFARRAPAKHIALCAGQVKGGKTISHVLTSEDLW